MRSAVRPGPGEPWSSTLRPVTWLLALGLFVAEPPSDLEAQFSDPCQIACAAVLGASGFVAATGASIAWGRATGGMATIDEGLLAWVTTFALVTGGGIALSGDGARQERAIYSAGIGGAAGALAGLAFGAARSSGDAPRILARTFIGAAAGVLVGGVYGALSHDEGDGNDPGAAVPLFSLSLPF